MNTSLLDAFRLRYQNFEHRVASTVGTSFGDAVLLETLGNDVEEFYHRARQVSVYACISRISPTDLCNRFSTQASSTMASTIHCVPTFSDSSPRSAKLINARWKDLIKDISWLWRKFGLAVAVDHASPSMCLSSSGPSVIGARLPLQGSWDADVLLYGMRCCRQDWPPLAKIPSLPSPSGSTSHA